MHSRRYIFIMLGDEFVSMINYYYYGHSVLSIICSNEFFALLFRFLLFIFFYQCIELFNVSFNSFFVIYHMQAWFVLSADPDSFCAHKIICSICGKALSIDVWIFCTYPSNLLCLQHSCIKMEFL